MVCLTAACFLWPSQITILTSFCSLQAPCNSAGGKKLICGVTVAFRYHRLGSYMLEVSNVEQEWQAP